jgi:2,3-dihydroxybiphenyl 1,2-dioxygenase
MGVRSLSYLVVESADLAGWERLAGEVLGMQVVPHGGGLRLRMDDRAQRVVVRPALEDRVVAVGWEMIDRADLSQVCDVLSGAGFEVHEASAEMAEDRAAEHLVWTLDPDGNRVEFACGMELADSPFSGGARPVSRFVTGDAGMGHVVLMAKDMAGMCEFYEGVLGFRLTERYRGGLMLFLRCNQRHHSVALLAAGATGVNHVMFEVGEIDDVGRGLDALRRLGGNLAADLGRHADDNVLSFYAWSPSGFMIEYGAEGRKVSLDAEPVDDGDGSWGHDGLRESHRSLIQRARSFSV